MVICERGVCVCRPAGGGLNHTIMHHTQSLDPCVLCPPIRADH